MTFFKILWCTNTMRNRLGNTTVILPLSFIDKETVLLSRKKPVTLIKIKVRFDSMKNSPESASVHRELYFLFGIVIAGPGSPSLLPALFVPSPPSIKYSLREPVLPPEVHAGSLFIPIMKNSSPERPCSCRWLIRVPIFFTTFHRLIPFNVNTNSNTLIVTESCHFLPCCFSCLITMNITLCLSLYFTIIVWRFRN